MSRISIVRTVTLRILDDYGLPDRGSEYHESLRSALEAGYDLISLADFHATARAGSEPSRRLLVLRHDVDVGDVAGNEAFYALELSLGARSTFYFRRSTVRVHARLISRLLDGGFEVGYHYEEASSLAKRDGIGSRHDMLLRRRRVEDAFQRNCSVFRRLWNPKLESVAAHGDWINRRLGFTNDEFISPPLLKSCGLHFEAYGVNIMGRADVYVSDVARSPLRWAGNYGLGDAIRDGRSPIYLLTHERRWHRAPTAKVRADLDRIADEVAYGLRVRRVGGWH